MYIYQNDKLYTQIGNGSLVGVDIYSDRVDLIAGTDTVMDDNAKLYTLYEVQCKFNVNECGAYLFPRELKVTEKGVDADVTVDEVKKPVRKRNGK